ncbi:KEOPS complex subunit Pcc1 [Halosimplex salinum]|uniref:KEOPS complex subunit Pcc1 n=1 Tax=Halosimplex salinum TaxID=1710538 RepID=UPI000F467556|nr:KEOPS complex subunit Pcc1 [Halosimplex salinum]
MDHEAVFECEYPDPESARRVERSVGVEVGDIEGDRTTATLDRDGATLTVTVAAADLVALRAGCNTWLSLVSVAETCGAATPRVDG